MCPTGALMAKPEWDKRADGTWDESRQTQTDTICPYCGVGCTLTLHVQDNEILKATSPFDQSVTQRQPLHQGALRLAIRAEPRREAARAPRRA